LIARSAALAFACSMAIASASAQTILSDSALIAFARQFQSSHWPDNVHNNRVVGRHDGHDVLIGFWCQGDNGCTVDYVINYDVAPGPECTKAGGRTAQAQTSGTVVVQVEAFCVPRILYDARLFAGPHILKQDGGTP
jgi:hypothetical protein